MSKPVLQGYKIKSDGTSDGTYVYQPNGEPMGLITNLTIQIDSNEKFLQAHITLLKAELDITVPEDQVTITEDFLPSKKEEAPE